MASRYENIWVHLYMARDPELIEVARKVFNKNVTSYDDFPNYSGSGEPVFGDIDLTYHSVADLRRDIRDLKNVLVPLGSSCNVEEGIDGEGDLVVDITIDGLYS